MVLYTVGQVEVREIVRVILKKNENKTYHRSHLNHRTHFAMSFVSEQHDYATCSTKIL